MTPDQRVAAELADALAAACPEGVPLRVAVAAAEARYGPRPEGMFEAQAYWLAVGSLAADVMLILADRS